jgi:hypothetical protein
MIYEITIERLEDTGEKYPNKIAIYSQRVDDLNVEAVIRAVNNIEDQQHIKK